MTRISILDKDRCQPKKCDYLCIHYCPGVRMDEDPIVIDEDTKKPLISEELSVQIAAHLMLLQLLTYLKLPTILFTGSAKTSLNCSAFQAWKKEQF